MLVCDVRLGPSRVCALGGGWHVGAVDRPPVHISMRVCASRIAHRVQVGPLGVLFGFS